MAVDRGQMSLPDIALELSLGPGVRGGDDAETAASMFVPSISALGLGRNRQVVEWDIQRLGTVECAFIWCVCPSNLMSSGPVHTPTSTSGLQALLLREPAVGVTLGTEMCQLIRDRGPLLLTVTQGRRGYIQPSTVHPGLPWWGAGPWDGASAVRVHTPGQASRGPALLESVPAQGVTLGDEHSHHLLRLLLSFLFLYLTFGGRTLS